MVDSISKSPQSRPNSYTPKHSEKYLKGLGQISASIVSLGESFPIERLKGFAPDQLPEYAKDVATKRQEVLLLLDKRLHKHDIIDVFGSVSVAELARVLGIGRGRYEKTIEEQLAEQAMTWVASNTNPITRSRFADNNDNNGFLFQPREARALKWPDLSSTD